VPDVANPHCPICATGSTRFLFERNSIRIYTCIRCKLQFQFPQPSDEQLAAIYSSSYFLGSKHAGLLENERALKRATARLYLNQLATQVPAGSRLLEIGCGHGGFLLEAQARGFQVQGLEYSSHAAREANAQLGASAVRVGSPEVECFLPAAYDAIAAFDVIEHLRKPIRALERLHSALRAGGVIAIVTPSLDSWSRRLFGRYWMEYKSEHLTYFSRKSLRLALEDVGFTDLQFTPNYKILNLEYIADHFERFPIPLLTPAVRILNRVLPLSIAVRPFRVVASGIMAIARKQ
jgi:2-polyprenyl-3-methyl-5-hydroxy-6-metoxy-1,4-benzoquinol methylase